MKKTRILQGLFLTFFLTAQAKVELPEQIGPHMVLQQQTQAKLWGWTKPGGKVTVSVSWNRETYTAQAGPQGRWELFVQTPAGSYTPQQVTVSDGEPVVLDDVLIGEVWLASGQSNMEMPLKGFENCPVEGSEQAIALSGQYRNRIRYATIERAPSYAPIEKTKGAWKVAGPSVAAGFGAAAWFFAENLTRVLDVPVGIINNAWGGSRVEGWLSAEVLKELGEPYEKADIDQEPKDWMRDEIMYNCMLCPLMGYTIKGCIWYQGESNIRHEKELPDRMARLITLWRKQWKQGDFPFYMVEVAPFNYGPDDLCGPLLREAQHNVVGMVPNTGIISTSDLVYPYEVDQVHACQKAKVGQRLSYLALTETYQIPGIPAYGPEYRSMTVEGGKIRLKFTHDQDAFSTVSEMSGFEICGADRKFVPAHAKADGKTILVWADQIAQPAAVRYCFHNFTKGTVSGGNNLPLVPFRTDNFE